MDVDLIRGKIHTNTRFEAAKKKRINKQISTIVSHSGLTLGGFVRINATYQNNIIVIIICIESSKRNFQRTKYNIRNDAVFFGVFSFEWVNRMIAKCLWKFQINRWQNSHFVFEKIRHSNERKNDDRERDCKRERETWFFSIKELPFIVVLPVSISIIHEKYETAVMFTFVDLYPFAQEAAFFSSKFHSIRISVAVHHRVIFACVLFSCLFFCALALFTLQLLHSQKKKKKKSKRKLRKSP